MFEFLGSPKTGDLITASLLFPLSPNLSISSRLCCTVSLRNVPSLGCRLELADAHFTLRFHKRYVDVGIRTTA
jgi:hypothetical protein